MTWFRPIWGRSALDAAWALYAVVMDSAVVPLKILSDRDSAFRSELILEFTALMGVRQGFSMAWSPESHGPVEREHLEWVRDTGKCLETVVDAKKEMWPLFLPLAEGKRRTRTLSSGHQPLALSRGYFGCSPLQTAMGALRSIPVGLPNTIWMGRLVSAHRLLLNEEMEDRADRAAVEEVTRNIQRGHSARA